jgi:hypothetical protein
MTNPIDSPAQGHPRNPPVRGPVHMEAELVIAALTGGGQCGGINNHILCSCAFLAARTKSVTALCSCEPSVNAAALMLPTRLINQL